MTTLYKQVKNDIINQISFLSNDSKYFDYSRGISNNNQILESLLDNLDETILYNNSNLLADFNDSHCTSFPECSLKPHNEKKLKEWLKDQSISFLFEDDLIIEKAIQYHKRSNSFYREYLEECSCELMDGLSFQDITEKQKDKLESMLDIYIPSDSVNTYYYIGGMGFELTLPKAAILREYKAANSIF